MYNHIYDIYVITYICTCSILFIEKEAILSKDFESKGPGRIPCGAALEKLSFEGCAKLREPEKWPKKRFEGHALTLFFNVLFKVLFNILK